MSRPILVTGTHRSGTTWIGKILSGAPKTAYIHEPFMLGAPRGVFDYPVPYWYFHVTPEVEAQVRHAFSDTLGFRYRYSAGLAQVRSQREFARYVMHAGRFVAGRLLSRRPLVKDPLALLSAEWLAAVFNMEVVVSIRHPVAFVSSLLRMGWRFDYRDLLMQQQLMKGLLADSRSDIQNGSSTHDDLENAAILWKVLHQVISVYKERHPDWSFVRYEDLATDAMRGFSAIFDRLDLRWTESVPKRIEFLSGRDNPAERPNDPRVTRVNSAALSVASRRRLSESDRRRIFEIVSPVAQRFYRDDEW